MAFNGLHERAILASHSQKKPGYVIRQLRRRNEFRKTQFILHVEVSVKEFCHLLFLSSPLAGKRDLVVIILVRCMCVRCADLSGP